MLAVLTPGLRAGETLGLEDRLDARVHVAGAFVWQPEALRLDSERLIRRWKMILASASVNASRYIEWERHSVGLEPHGRRPRREMKMIFSWWKFIL